MLNPLPDYANNGIVFVDGATENHLGVEGTHQDFNRQTIAVRDWRLGKAQ